MTPMPLLEDDDRRELLWRIFVALQGELRSLGRLPRERPTVLTRLGPALAFAGAVQLGVLVACFSVFAVLVVTRLILHLDLTRYFGP